MCMCTYILLYVGDGVLLHTWICWCSWVSSSRGEENRSVEERRSAWCGGSSQACSSWLEWVSVLCIYTYVRTYIQWNLLTTYLKVDTESVLIIRSTYVHTIWVGLCTWGIHRDRMRSTYYPGVCTKPGTYYQGWFMYMRYTQGQNEEYLLSRSMY